MTTRIATRCIASRSTAFALGIWATWAIALTPEQIDFFRDLDVLLALAGGYPTLALDELKTVIDAVKPRLVVPMHFRTLRLKRRNQFWVQTFLDYFPDELVDFAFDCEISLSKANLPESMRVLVLTYAG